MLNKISQKDVKALLLNQNTVFEDFLKTIIKVKVSN